MGLSFSPLAIPSRMLDGASFLRPGQPRSLAETIELSTSGTDEQLRRFLALAIRDLSRDRLRDDLGRI